MKKILAIVLIAAMVLASFAGCGNTETAKDEVTLTIGLDGNPFSLDPAFAYDWEANPVVIQVNESLLVFDENNQMQPLLCESWEVVDDVTYVYNVRSDVEFSNGEAMTMEDVMYSVNRIADPEFGSYLQWMYDCVESITQTGDWQFTVVLKEPNANWQYTLATTAGAVVNKKQAEELGDKFGTESGLPIGTGAYVHESWTNGSELILVKNDNYWDKDQEIQVDKLIYKAIEDDTTRSTAIMNGDVDFVVDTPADFYDNVAADEDLVIYPIGTFGVTYLQMNTEVAPFNDARVRQAVYCAIDMEAIQENIIKTNGRAGQVMPNSIDLCSIGTSDFQSFIDSAETYSYDVERAKALLAEAGYADGFDCNVIVNNSAIRYNIALAIQEYLKAVGITLSVDQLDSGVYYDQKIGVATNEDGTRMYDMVMGSWEADYPDINANFEPLYASYNIDNGFNGAAYANEEVDALIKKCNASTDDAERVSCLIEAMTIANDDMPLIPLFYAVRQMTLDKHYSGFNMSASWVWNMLFKDCKYTADAE